MTDKKPTAHVNYAEFLKRTRGYTAYESGLFCQKFVFVENLPDDEIGLRRLGGLRWDKFRDQFVVRDGRWRLKPGLVVFMTVHDEPPP